MRKLLLLTFLLFAFAMPALAFTSGETMLAPPEFSSAPGMQFTSSVASDGDTYFAAWTDVRAGDGIQRIYGSRLTRDGVPLDGAGIMLSDEFTGEARVVFAGGNYFVMWQTSAGAAAKRVSRDGIVLDAEPLHPLRDLAFFTGAIATNGTDIALMWQTATFEPHVSILDAAGNVKSDIVTEINDTTARIAWNGSAFVVTSAFFPSNCYPCPPSLAKIYFVFPTGVISPPVITAGVVDQGWYSMAALEDRILIVSATYAYGLSFWLFDNEGSLIRQTRAYAPALTDHPAVTADGNSFLVAWTESAGTEGHLLAVRMSREGVLPAEPSQVTTPSASIWPYAPAIATNGSGVLYAWTSQIGPAVDQRDIVAQRLTAALNPEGPEARITIGPAAQDLPVITAGGRTWLVGWIDDRGMDGAKVVVMRRSSDGTGIDGAPLEAAQLSFAMDASRRAVSVASSGEDFLVAWADGMNLFVRRFASTGQWLDDAPRLVSDQLGDFSSRGVAWSGSNYFVVWSRYTASDSRGPLGVYGAAIGIDGSIGPPMQISPQPSATSDAMVDRVGDRWLVAWNTELPEPCQITCPSGDTDVIGARVTFDGNVLDTVPIQLSARHATTSGFSDYARLQSLASSGDIVLVVWSSGRNLSAARVSSSGVVLDSSESEGTRLARFATYPGRAAAAWDGKDYLLLVSTRGPDLANSVLFFRIRGGEPLGALGEGSELSRGVTSPQGAYMPAIAAKSDGRALIAYPRATFASPYNGVSRIFARTIEASQKSRAIRR